MAQPAVAEIIRDARARLTAVGIVGPDAELLAAWAAGRSLGELRIDMALGRALDADALTRFGAAVTRRLAREPLQHITGLAPFRHIELAVGPGVFTPRPETELLVDVTLDHLRTMRSGSTTVLDVGTGTGAVAISIARESDARVVAVEASPAAFVWARRNMLALSPQTVLLHGDARDTAALAAVGIVPGSLAALVSNPPYVPHAAVPADHEVRQDPATALYSGADGLDLIRDLIALAAQLVEPGGLVAFEHTEEQGAMVQQLLESSGFRDARTHTDLTGRDRVTAAIR